VHSNKKAQFVLRTANHEMENELPTMMRLLNAAELSLDAAYKAESGVPVAVTLLGEIFLPISGGDKQAERERLKKEIGKMQEDLRIVEVKLNNKSFVERAPADVVEEHRRRREDLDAQLSKLKQARRSLE
jgi:valyl-tRNA synthetase